MAPNEFIGRDKEAAALRKSYSSEKSKFVAVYGRKGVGKTSLVRNILGDRLDFEFTASCGITQRLQRRRFQNALDLKTGSRGKVPADWFAAFDRLKDYLPSLGRERAVVLLDGLPSMDAPKSLFISALSYFWNGWHSESTPADRRSWRALRQDQQADPAGTLQPARDRRVSHQDQRHKLKPEADP